MPHSDHRPGVQVANLVHRRVKLAGLGNASAADLVREIDGLIGIDSVCIEGDPPILDVSYDASKRCLAELEQLLGKHGGRIADDWWTRFKTGWYRQTDTNVRDNALHDPHCCNKPPV